MKTLLIALFTLTANLLIAQTWFEVSVPTENKLNAIDFPSSTTGYIVGDSVTILKTSNGGVTWDQVPLTGISVNNLGAKIIDVDFVDENIGFILISGVNQGPYKTIDGGDNWVLLSNGLSNMCYKNSIFVNTENDFFLGGAGCFQSGQIEHFVAPNWNFTTVNYESFHPSEYIAEIDFNNGVGIAAMHNEYFLRSIDNGSTWDTIPSGLDDTFKLTSVMFATADSVYAGYEDVTSSGSGILRSYDAGLTWSQDINSALMTFPSFLSLGKANNGKVYCGTNFTSFSEAYIFETTDGISWGWNRVNQTINGIDSYGTDVTFAVGDSGYVLVNKPVGTLGVVNENYLNSINVYPNPTQDLFTIENKSYQKMVYNLFNINGQILISDIVSTNKATIDISFLAPGIYYLKPTGNNLGTGQKIVKF